MRYPIHSRMERCPHGNDDQEFQASFENLTQGVVYYAFDRASNLCRADYDPRLPLFWSLPTAFLAGTGAAAGIAMINSLGNLAGFLSPYLVGWLKQVTASNASGMYMLAAFMVLGGLLALSVPKRVVNR